MSSKDAAEVLNFFIDVTAAGQLGGRASGYFGYLKTGVDLSLNMVAAIDETLTQQILSVIKGSMNRCPCLDALAGLSMLKGELREIGTIFNAVGR